MSDVQEKGFSLIEMVAVLLILAVVAAAAALRTTGPMRNARMQDVTGEIAGFDMTTRTYAREQDKPVYLVVDLSAGRLSRVDRADGRPLGAPLELPAGYRIVRFRTGSDDIWVGSASLPCSRQGLTATYAMAIEGPAGRSRWLLVAGLSGQVVEMENEQEIREIFEATGAGAYAG